MEKKLTQDTKLSFLAGQYTREREYWNERFSGFSGKAGFPRDFVFDGGDGGDGGDGVSRPDRVPLTVPPVPDDVHQRLSKASGGSEARMFVLLTAVMACLLHKTTHQNDITLGIPIETQPDGGEYINTALAIRHYIGGDMTFRDVLGPVRDSMVAAAEHQNYPVETIPRDLGLENTNDFELFDTAMVFEGLHRREYLDHLVIGTVFCFSIRQQENQHELVCRVEYDPRFYAPQTVSAIYGHYLHLLRELLFNAGEKLCHLGLLDEERRRELVVEWNRRDVDWDGGQTAAELLARCAARVPDHRALTENVRHLTYGEYFRQVLVLAGRLETLGMGPGTIAAVMGHRTLEMPVILSAVMMTRAAYLPINAMDPGERVGYLLADSGASFVLAHEHALQRHREKTTHLRPARIMDIRRMLPVPPGESAACRTVTSSPGDAAYIIYTSGTTGRPKGVVIEQRNLVNYLHWAFATYMDGVGDDENQPAVPFYTSFSFDMSVTSIFMPLVGGSGVEIYGGDEKEFILERVVADNRVGVLKATPSHLKLLSGKLPPVLRGRSRIGRIIVGGEKLETPLATDICREFGNGVAIYNEYGPTEATVGCMTHCHDPALDLGDSVPIGVPIANTGIYLLDPALKPVPPGIAGQLTITGSGIARGYLNQPDLTAETFTPYTTLVPSNVKGKLLRGVQGGTFRNYRQWGLPTPHGRRRHGYITGDLARWVVRREPPVLEYLGRRDRQVKIRGYRVEPQEIREVLVRHESVGDAVVVVRRDSGGDMRLDAYVKDLVPGIRVAAADLKEFLGRTLPDYMVPTHITWIDTIPVTAAGKIDTAALPEPETGLDGYTAPRNRADRKLVTLWSRLLDLEEEQIGIDLNFFEVGGHSLKASVLTAGLLKEFGRKVALADVFRYPTIRGQSDFLAGLEAAEFRPVVPVEQREYYPASPAQQRLYFLQQMDGGTGYNVPAALVLEGDETLENRIKEVFQQLAQRHEALRTSFEIIGQSIYQRIHPEVGVEVSVEENIETKNNTGTGPRDLEDRLVAFTRPFDLSRAPLVRVALLKTGKNRYILLVDMHHIITDEVSTDILIRDFTALYAGDAPAAPTVHYKDYCQWLEENHAARQDALRRQEAYWLGVFADEIPPLKLPADHPRPQKWTYDGAILRFTLTGEPVRRLADMATMAPGKEITLYMVLLAAYSVLLSVSANSRDIIIGSPVFGRTHPDLQQMIGMFVNMVLTRTRPDDNRGFAGFLEEVKSAALGAFDNQDYQFGQLIGKLGLQEDSAARLLPATVFTLQNAGDPQFEKHFHEKTGVKMTPFDREKVKTKFDLTLDAIGGEDEIRFWFTYSTELFDHATIEKMRDNYLAVLEQITQNPEIKIKDLDLPHTARANTAILEEDDGDFGF